MTKILKVLIAVAVPVALVSASAAEAVPAAKKAAAAVKTKAGGLKGKGKGKGKGRAKVQWSFVKALVRHKALPASALKQLNDQSAKIKGCYRAARVAKKIGRVECRALRIASVELQAKIYKSAKPNKPWQVNKLKKYNSWLSKRLARIRANQAKHKAKPAAKPVAKPVTAGKK